MIRKFLFYILFALTVFALIVYVGSTRPDLLNKFLIAFDKFSITEVGQIEQTRVARIKQLPITYEEKQVLLSRTVFIGATIDMVRLALGEPKKAMKQTVQAADGTKEERITLYYHFAEDKKPTVLEFEDNLLISAKKGSALDLEQAAGE